jgi:hypothetical protein
VCWGEKLGSRSSLKPIPVFCCYALILLPCHETLQRVSPPLHGELGPFYYIRAHEVDNVKRVTKKGLLSQKDMICVFKRLSQGWVGVGMESNGDGRIHQSARVSR